MAVYTLYCCDLRMFPMSSNDGGLTWYCPISCEAILVDSNGNYVPPTGFGPESAVFTFVSSEPLEYGDDMADLRRKAISGAWTSVWTTVDPQVDTVTEFWVDAV